MAQLVDESDLVSEDELEQPSETAAARRAAIQQTPESGPPANAEPLWNPKVRRNLRFVGGVVLPTIGATIASGGAAAPASLGALLGAGGAGGAAVLGGMGGTAVSEGLDALMSPGTPFSGQGEQPSLLGAGARVAAQGAIPAVASKVGETLSPLVQKLPNLIPKAALESEAASLVRNVIHKAQLFKAVPTEDKTILNGIVQEATHYSPLIDAKDILQTLSDRGKQLVFQKGATKAAFDDIVDAVKIAAKDGNGNIALPELHLILRTARQQASSKAERMAIGHIKNDILDTMEKHISSVHPLGPKAGTLFRRLNNEIGTKLGIAEDAMKLMAVDPMKAIRNVANNPEARGVIKALDHLTGSGFGPQIDALNSKVIREGAKVGQTAVIKAAQTKARGLLKGILAVTATGAGAASSGGAGAGAGLLLSLFLGRMPGALPLEGLAARTAMGAAKVAPAVTSAVGKGAEALFGGGEESESHEEREPVSESDLEKEP